MRPIPKCVMSLAVLFVVLIVFSGRLASGLTVKEEEDLSRQVMATILKYYPLIDDPVVVEYINALGNKLVAYLPEKLFQYHFYFVKTDSYNAFATPAGYIFVNSGLLLAMEDEGELAGILAHEIAHVYCRHISQKIERSKKINMATLEAWQPGSCWVPPEAAKLDKPLPWDPQLPDKALRWLTVAETRFRPISWASLISPKQATTQRGCSRY